jgi:HlyD family secretion protein
MYRLLGWIIILALLAAGGYAGWTYYNQPSTPTVKFRLAPVQKGEIVSTIGATGTLEPEEVIDVGAQVAGQIISFGKDANGKTVDYGSVVQQGKLLAQVDSALYEADVASVTAQLEVDKSSVNSAQANLGQLKAKLDQAQRDWERAQKLGPSDALAQETYDTYQGTFEAAKAAYEVGKVAIAQAQAILPKDEADVMRAKRNLAYCTITSPVDGVVIDRRVNIGQTVVSSLSAPSLFLLAKDLSKMQLWVPVNEADIGQIKPDQAVTFSVDAYPGRTFKGTVGKIRLNATMTQNVVTYVVEVEADNSKGKLLPYLTANVQFELERRPDVLEVPNAALRYVPAIELVSPAAREAAANAATTAPADAASKPVEAQGSGGHDGNGNGGKRKGGRSKISRIWVQDGLFVRPITVKTGLTDGAMTEVTGEGLEENLQVIVGEQSTAEKNTTKNPFALQMGGRGR